MTNTQNEALQRAIVSLGAVEVALGRYAFEDEQPGREGTYCVVGWDEAEKLLEPYREQGWEDATVLPHLWPYVCSHAHEMPAWWTPERRFATRYTGEPITQEYVAYATAQEAWSQTVRSACARRAVTAELETGEEVPC